jgi:Holliday junction resolvasome RuvABC endonuclease subunit
MENDKIIDSGCIKTEPQAGKLKIRKGDDRARRTSELASTLLSIIETYSIGIIVSELPHGSQTASSAVMMGIVVGVGQTLADCLKLPIEWYTEADAKKILLGRNKGTKQETIIRVSQMFNYVPTRAKYIEEAVCDAVAVYVAARETSPLLRYAVK